MKKKFLNPDQIITLRDYPVYNEQILKIYFRVFSKNQGKILPPCPVIHKSIGIPYIKKKDVKSKRYNNLLRKFLKDNPHAEYFLIDGGHKSVAATLANKRIPVFVVEKNADLKEAQKLTSKGEIFGWYNIKNCLNINGLAKHHFGTKKFQTVKDKVKKMVCQKDIPKYMIMFYKK